MVLYEPAPTMLSEAKHKLGACPNVTLAASLKEVHGQAFDAIFCLEVFEHLTSDGTRTAIESIFNHLLPRGVVIVGVPYEVHLAALFKGVFRMSRRFGDFDARPGNVLKAALGRPPRNRPVADIAAGLPYHYHHLGFDHRALESEISDRFRITRKWFSPFPVLGPLLNSEIYYLLSKRPDPARR